MENKTLEKVEVQETVDWEGFVKGKLLNFLAFHDMDKIVAHDENGRRATIKRDSQGAFKIQIVKNETM